MKAKISILFTKVLLLFLFVYLCGMGPCIQIETVKGKKQLYDTITIQGVNADLYSITYTTPHKGIIVGESGTILQTTNAGYNWSSITPITNKILYSVAACDTLHMVAVGENGKILRSTDEGANWDSSIVNTKQTLRGVAFNSASVGYAVGDSGVVLSTTDFGVTWTKYPRGDSLQSLYSVSFNAQDTIVIVGNNGVVLKGPAFINLSFTAENLRSVHFALGADYFSHVNTGFIVGNNGSIFKTTDGGITWSPDSTFAGKSFRSVFLTNSHWGYAVGSNGTVVRYNGTNWTMLPQVSTKNLNGVDPVWQVTSTLIADDGGDFIVYPSVIPVGIANIEPLTLDCVSWPFELTISSLTFNTGGEEVTIHHLSANSNGGVTIVPTHRSGTGWAYNDFYHAETGTPTTTTLTGFTLTASSINPNIVTCCFVDTHGNPWLIESFECPAP